MSRSHTHIFYLLIGLCFSVNIQGQILDRHLSDLYADKFNQQDKEIYIQSISNKQAKDFSPKTFLFSNVPIKISKRFIISDGGLIETYKRNTRGIYNNRISSLMSLGLGNITEFVVQLGFISGKGDGYMNSVT